MTKHELTIVTNFLHGLYGDRFPGLTLGMAQFWYEDLQDLDLDLVIRGAKRWARHHTLKAPGLDELRESIEWVQEADLKARLPTPTNPLRVLLEAQQKARSATPEYTSADRVFGKLMIKLLEYRTRQEDRYSNADCAGHLLEWARYYRPKSAELAGWLERQSAQYERLALQEADTAPRPFPATTMPRLGDDRAVALPELPCVHARVDEAQGSCIDCGEVLHEESVGD